MSFTVYAIHDATGLIRRKLVCDPSNLSIFPGRGEVAAVETTVDFETSTHKVVDGEVVPKV